eukprot:TRINITY_DN1883_c0_g1_i1.p1 TRINITY_DN1883_c0_g1~~TRINITY_DN1883_c0_g1_i1.p1  ORF type:complete len:929 (+),score=164.55 TRINITY_DN1883_c0_g1_i1:130-2916(+)
MTRFTVALVASLLAFTSVKVEANKLHAVREALARIHIAHEYSRSILDTRTKAGPLQASSSSQCPDGKAPVACIMDPCRTATCASNPNAQCVADYCGGCNAIFYDANRQAVAGCGSVPDCAAILCSKPYCPTGQKVMSSPTQCCPFCGPDTTAPPPTQTCRADQEYQTCGSSCPPTCGVDSLAIVCSALCVPGCFCKSGTFLDPVTDSCVATCPTKPDCSAVACPAVACGANMESFTPPNACCPECRPVSRPCPDGSAPTNCLVDPCGTATCASNPNAQCVADYCGGCNAIFYDANGQTVAGCGAVPDCSTVRCAAPTCTTGQKAVKPLTGCCQICVPADTTPPPPMGGGDLGACAGPFIALMMDADCSGLAEIIGTFSSAAPPSILTLQRFCAGACISKLIVASKKLTGDCAAFGGMVQWVVQAVCMRDEKSNFCYPQLSRLQQIATTNTQTLAAPTPEFLQATCNPCTRKILSAVSTLPPSVSSALGSSGGLVGPSSTSAAGSGVSTGSAGTIGSGSNTVDVDSSLQQLDLLCTTSGGKDQQYCAVALSGLTNQVSAAAGISTPGKDSTGSSSSSSSSSSTGNGSGSGSGTGSSSTGSTSSSSSSSSSGSLPPLVTAATADATTLNLASVGTFADSNWVQDNCQNRCFQKMAIKAAAISTANSASTPVTSSSSGSSSSSGTTVVSSMAAAPADPTKSLKYQCVRDDEGRLCVPQLQAVNLAQATCDQLKASIASAGCCASSYQHFLDTAADSAAAATYTTKLSTCGITLPSACPVTRGTPAQRSITLTGDVATLTQPKMRDVARIDIASRLGIASDFVTVGQFVAAGTKSSAKLQTAQASSSSTGTVTAPVTISGSSQSDIDAAAADFDAGVDLTSVNSIYTVETGAALTTAPPAPVSSPKVDNAAGTLGISVLATILFALTALMML